MKKSMKTENFFAIKLNMTRITISILLVFSIISVVIHVKNNKLLTQLKSDLTTQQCLSGNLESRLDDLESKNIDLESQNSDLENRINDIESRTDDLENNRSY